MVKQLLYFVDSHFIDENEWLGVDRFTRQGFIQSPGVGWGGGGCGKGGISPSLDFITNLFQHVTTSQPIRSSGHGSQGPKFMGSIYP